MPTLIKDPYLEGRLLKEAKIRGYSTKSKTATTLIQERLGQLEAERRDNHPVASNPSVSIHASGDATNPPEGQGVGINAAPTPFAQPA